MVASVSFSSGGFVLKEFVPTCMQEKHLCLTLGRFVRAGNVERVRVVTGASNGELGEGLHLREGFGWRW